MDIEFTVRLVVRSAIDPESLADDYNDSMLEYIKFLSQEEGLLGCVDDEYQIIEAHEYIEPSTTERSSE